MMINLTTLTNRLGTFLQRIKFKNLFTFLLIGMMTLLTVAPAAALAGQNRETLPSNVKQALRDDDSDRPKTTGEWNAEAHETEGQPVERAKRITKEAGEAVKDWAELYPDVAERTVPALGDDNNSR